MPNLHDLLGKISDDDEQPSSPSGREQKPSGISPLDIAELPEPQKKVMFFILRDKKAASEGLSFDELKNQFPDEVLDDTIQELTAENWLVVNNNGRYKLNLRRSRKRLSSENLWKTLSSD